MKTLVVKCDINWISRHIFILSSINWLDNATCNFPKDTTCLKLGVLLIDELELVPDVS